MLNRSIWIKDKKKYRHKIRFFLINMLFRISGNELMICVSKTTDKTKFLFFLFLFIYFFFTNCLCELRIFRLQHLQG
jgi:hypothetical protein